MPFPTPPHELVRKGSYQTTLAGRTGDSPGGLETAGGDGKALGLSFILPTERSL
jgi:hypothetical protein